MRAWSGELFAVNDAVFKGEAHQSQIGIRLSFEEDESSLSIYNEAGQSVQIEGRPCFFQRQYHCFKREGFQVVLIPRTNRTEDLGRLARLLVDVFEIRVQKPKEVPINYNAIFAFVCEEHGLVLLDTATLLQDPQEI